MDRGLNPLPTPECQLLGGACLNHSSLSAAWLLARSRYSINLFWTEL